MDADVLIRGVLSSVLGSGRKRSNRALRYLNGGGGSIWTRPTTLLTAAGVAWGIYETLQQRGPHPASTAGGVPSPAAGATLPPLPGTPADIDREALRVVQLAISAANADGVMNEKERAAVLQQAKSGGVGEIVERELNHPRPLAEIVAGVQDPAERATLYVLAFTVLRADEQLTGAERIYLAQLAHLLGLDPATVQRIEKDTGERIDALGDQGQLGG
jgi:uncharacterized membrane protein YebE (DUF533 family)